MVYRKKVYKKKATGARRRPALRRRRLVRAPSTGGFYIRRRVPTFGVQGSISTPGNVTSTNNMLVLGTPTLSASGGTNMYDVPFSVEFRLNQLESFTDITVIADKYRLVNALIRVCTSNVALGAGAGLIMPWIQYISDHDDSSVPTNSIISQKMGVRTLGFNQRGQAVIYCKPLPSNLIYGGPAGTGIAYAVPRRSPYIDATNSDVPHFAVKGIIRNVFLPGTANTANFAVEVQMTVHAKDLQ